MRSVPVTLSSGSDRSVSGPVRGWGFLAVNDMCASCCRLPTTACLSFRLRFRILFSAGLQESRGGADGMGQVS